MDSPKSRFAKHVLVAGLIANSYVFALPKQASINGGEATISSDAASMIIDQHSDLVSIDYQSFDIASNESVIFQQPSVNSVALNRVIGNDASEIFGVLQSNGKVFLVNPNGVLFGENARVDVGSLLVSTKAISDDDFMQSDFRFAGDQEASIVNQGLVQAADDGFIVFVSNRISNEGEMIAPKGRIELISSDELLLDISGEAVSIVSNQQAVNALIENHGLLASDGGLIVLNADAKDALTQTVVNNTGVIRANSFVEQNGEIYIVGNQGDVVLDGELHVDGVGNANAGVVQVEANRIAVVGEITGDGDLVSSGGDINLDADTTIFLADGSSISADAGREGDGGSVIAFTPGNTFFATDSTLSAKGGLLAGNGGFLEVSGLEKVEVFGQVDTSAQNGDSGTFYIDPYDITISNAVSANGAFDAGSPNSWEGSGVGTSSTINSAAITAALAGSDVIINTALDDGSGPGTGTGTITISNDIDLDGGNGNSLSFVADDTITLAANVKIEDKATGSADAVTVNLTSSNNIIFNNDADIFTTGGNATIIASNNLQLAGNASIQTAGGTISINALDVDLVGSLVSTSFSDSAISITSSQQIADSGAGTIDISATNGGVVLTADEGIDIDIAATKLDVTNVISGDVTIEGNGDLDITDITISAASTTNILKNNENGNSSGAVTVSGYTASGNLNISSDSSITIPDAGLNLGTSALTMTGTDLLDVSGRILDITAGSLTLSTQTAGGNSTFNTTATSLNLTNGGSNQVTVSETDALSLTGLSASGATDITTGGALTIPDAGLNVGTSALSLTATDIVDVSGRTLDLTAGALTLDTQTTGGAVVVNTTATSLDFTNSGTNQATINETNALTISAWSNAGNSVISAGGVLTIPDAGLNEGTDSLSITATDIIDSDRIVNLTAGALTLNTQTSGGASLFNTTAASLDLTNGGTNAVSVVEADALNLTALSASGATDITTGGVLTIPDAGLNVGANDLTLSATDLIDVSGRDLNITANDLYLSATSMTTDTNFTTSVDSLDANFAGSGNLLITNDKALQLLDSTNDGNADALIWSTDDMSIVTTAGDITVTDAIELDGLTSGETLALNAANDLLINTTISDKVGGVDNDVRLDLDAGNDITMASTAFIDAGDGTTFGFIDLDAAGDITLTGLKTLSTSGSAITVTTTAGAIVDAGDVSTDVDARNGRIQLTAETGIDDIETQVNTIDLSNTTSGTIVINEVNNLGLFTLVSAGDVTLNAGTNIAISNDIDLEGDDGTTYTFNATTDIDINQNVCEGGSTCASVDDNVNLNFIAGGDINIASGAVLDPGAAILDLEATGTLTLDDPGISIVGDLNLTANDILDASGRDLDLDANDLFLEIANLGGSTNFTTSVDTLDANISGTANLVINNDKAIQLLDSTNDTNTDALTMGSGGVTVTTAGAGNLDVAGLMNLDGANGQTLTLNSANDLLLSTGGGIEDSATGSADAVNITLIAANDITHAANTDIESYGGNISITATGDYIGDSLASVISGNGTISVNANDVQIVGSLSSNSSLSNAITVISANTIDAAGARAGANILADSGGAILTSANGMDVDSRVASLNLTNTTSGNIVIDEDNSVDITGLSFAGGDVTITTLNSGDLTASGTLDLDGANGQTLNLIAANDLVFSAGGEILDSVTGSIDTVAINLTAGNDMTFASNSDVESYGGNITMLATGAFTSNSGSDVRSGTGTINLNANGISLIGALRSDNTTTNAITITSLDDITEGGASNINVSASAGGLDLNSSNGIDLDINVASVDISNVATGDVILEGTGDLEIVNLATSAVSNVSILKNNENGNSSGNVILSSYANSSDLTITSDGSITIPDSGLNIGANNLSMTGTDIIDVSGRILDITASALTLNTQTAGGSSTFSTTADTLDLTNGGINAVTVNETDALTLSALSVTGDTSINTGGVLTIPDAGLNTGVNSLYVSANDIQDASGRDLNFSADQLSLVISNPTAGLSLNTSVSELQATMGAPADLSVTQSGALALEDIQSLGSAIRLADGDLSLTSDGLNVNDAIEVQQGSMNLLSNGDMTVNADLRASDVITDGIREGLIDIAVDNGALSIGDLSGLSIVSNNTADQSATGGLGTTPSDSVAIRFRQLDAGTTAQPFVIGDGVGADTLIQAVGGDIYIDSVGGTGADADGNRLVSLNSDVTFEAFNTIGDANTGSVSASNVMDSGATLSAAVSRAIQINAIPPTPPATPDPEPTLPEVVEDLVSDLLAEEQGSPEQATDPLDAADPSIAEKIDSDNSQVSKTFSRAFQGCSDSQRTQNSSNCRTENIMVKFLSSFIIGGALPGATE